MENLKNKENIEPTKYKKKSLWLETWIRFKRNKLAMTGLVILAIIVVLALSADLLFDYETVVTGNDIPNALKGVNKNNWLGTDEFGRDVLGRIVHGARISLSVGIVTILVSINIGGVFGALAGYYGGKIDNVIMRIMDVFLAIPNLLLAIAIVSALGPNMVNLVMAISISNVPWFARIVRAAVISVKDEEFIEAARASGAKNSRIIFKEVLPNCMAPIIVQGSIGVAGAILIIAAMSFIGLGVQAPRPEWGSMLSSGRTYIRDHSHLTIFPGLAIAITSLSINILGDGLRDALDPKLRD